MSTRILVIDDSPMLRQFIARSLNQHTAEYEVIAAPDGERGLALMELETPDLILLDFMLPGMKGDDICHALAKSPLTSGIPVVLMSGSPSDLERTATACSNVVKSISKPFTPELLCATVGGVVRALAEKSAAKLLASTEAPRVAHAESARSGNDIRGHTGNFSLHSVLLAIENDEGTGVLRLFAGDEPTLLYFRNGQAILATTKDVAAYLGSSLALVPKSMQDEQSSTGCPMPLIALARGEIEPAIAVEQSHLGGMQLFASAWTRPDTDFQFEPLDTLPAWLAEVPPFAGSVSKWALETLREVEEVPSNHTTGDETSVPAYTRRGYDRISRILLNGEERRVARLVDNRRSVVDIAVELSLPVKKTRSILFRFLSLEIIDHWPATVLRRA